MKKSFAGVALFVAVFWFWPKPVPLAEIWNSAWNPGIPAGLASTRENPDDLRIAEGPVATTLPNDTLPAEDPFGLPAAREPVVRSVARTDLGVPPPPRPWKATGRVGERAAVLSNPDGRVLVVASGARVDSASVVSIGTDGVVLEDRAGRFVIKLP